MSHELRWSWKRQGLVIVPTHPLDETGGCGWVGDPVDDEPPELVAAALEAGWDRDEYESVAHWMIESGDDELRAGGRIYKMSSEGDLCVVTGWCSFQRDSFRSVVDAIESSDWVGDPDAEVVLAQVEAWEQEWDQDYPEVTKLGPVAAPDTGGAEYAETILRRLVSAGHVSPGRDPGILCPPYLWVERGSDARGVALDCTEAERDYLRRLAANQRGRGDIISDL